MKREGDCTGWLRRTAALISALALLFHIGVMAFGAGQPLSLGNGITQARAHHDTNGASAPADAAGHKAPCCILSVCPGLPGPPLGHALAFLPNRAAGTPVQGAGPALAVSRLPLLPPVGARAPPMLA